MKLIIEVRLPAGSDYQDEDALLYTSFPLPDDMRRMEVEHALLGVGGLLVAAMAPIVVDALVSMPPTATQTQLPIALRADPEIGDSINPVEP